MRISGQRLLLEAVNFALALLFAAPVGILLERLMFPDTRLCRLAAFACLSVLGYIAERVLRRTGTRGRTAVAVLLAVEAVVVAAVLAAAPGFSLFASFYALYAAIITFFLFVISRKTGYAVNARFVTAGIVIYVLALIIMYFTEVSGDAIGLVVNLAAAYFLLSLYAFNLKGLRGSLHRDADKKTVGYPKGMQTRNLMLVTAFVVVVLAVSNFSPILTFLGAAAKGLISGVAGLFRWFSSLFDGLDADGTEDAVPAEAESIFDEVSSSGESLLGQIIFYVVVVACLLAIAILLIMWLKRSSGRFLRGLRALLDRLRSVFESEEEEYYSEEVEDLLASKRLLDVMKGRVLRNIKKLSQRPEHIDDMPDNRMKVRFAYKELLKKGRERSPSALCKTPYEFYENELGGDHEIEEFIRCYNDARYSEGDIPDSAVALARSALRFRPSRRGESARADERLI